MSIHRLALFPLCLLGLLHVSNAKTDLVSLVDVNSWVVLEVNDIEEVTEAFVAREHDGFFQKTFDRLWSFPTWNRGTPPNSTIKPSAEEKVQPALDKLKELVSGLNGQIVVTLSGDPKQMAENFLEAKQFLPDFIFTAHTNSKESQLKEFADLVLVADEAINGKRENPIVSMKEHSGTNVFYFDDEIAPFLPNVETENQQLAVFISKGIWGITHGEKNAVNLLKQIKEDSSPGSMKKIFQDAFKDIEQRDLNVFFNARSFAGLFEFLKTNKLLQLPKNPLKVTTPSILDGLSLGSLQNVSTSVDIAANGGTFHTSINLRDWNGIWALYKLGKKHGELPKFVPDGIYSASHAGIDLEALWPTIENILFNISPQLKDMADFQIQVWDKTYRINIKQDLLDNLGDEICNFSRMPGRISYNLADEGFQSGDVTAIRIKNSEQFESAFLQLAKGYVGENLNTRNYKGSNVYYASFMENQHLSFAVAKEWFVLSSGKHSEINHLLDVLNSPSASAESLWSSSEIKKIVEDAPSGIVHWHYFNLEIIANIVKSLFENVLTAASQLSDEKIETKIEFPTFPYFILSWSKVTENGLQLKTSFMKKDI